MKARPDQITNLSDQDIVTLANQLEKQINTWLNGQEFRPIQNKLRQKLNSTDEVRLIIQTDNIQIQRLPWHLWNFFEDYPQAEVALSAPVYDKVDRKVASKNKVRIIAILGDSQGIDTETDRKFLESLPDAEAMFLVEPQRRELTNQLWDEQGWDIIFFAGHSSSQADGETGKIYLNKKDSYTLDAFKFSLKKAIERGSKLAIFNSCDGLGLANQLASLHIPQIIVMREPVPDVVAQEFLKNFLTAFASGKSFYLAVREAREKLQGLENHFPCASWLPVICQNPAEIPPTWESLRGISRSN